ncbi:MAG: lipoyl(octanoyl) transferase LipB [Dehalococcoidia bacterium]
MQRDLRATCAVHRLGLVEYREALAEQRRHVEACRGDGQPRLLLLEHPPAYTFGARGRSEHLLVSEGALARLGAQVYRTDRGGDVTFHGPGQLVAYPIVDLRRWDQGPRWYVRSLEQVLIRTLAAFGITGYRVEARPGVWTDSGKIAAIGVHVSRGITSHGFALNVDPDLDYFSHIVPCGLAGVTVTSMALCHSERSEESDQPHQNSNRRAPAMNAVMDAAAEAFGHVFDLDMQDTHGRVAVAALTG